MSFRRVTNLLLLLVGLALALSVLSFLLNRWVGVSGITRTVYREPGFVGDPLGVAVVHDVDLGFMHAAHAPRRNFSVLWSGVWYIEEAGAYELSLGADDSALLRIDGEVLLDRNAAVGYSAVSVSRTLSAGPHTIEIEYEQRGGRSFLTTGWARAGERARTFASAALFTRAPTASELRMYAWLAWVRIAAIVSWIVVVALIAWRGVVRARRAIASDARGWRGVLAESGTRIGSALRRAWPWLAPAAAVLVVIAAAAIRFEIICVMYGPFDRPAWLYELEAHAREPISWFRPNSFSVGAVANPYAGGDPINYLRFARDMTSFYAAHVREPVFPFATRLWLWLVDDQNVAVSFASASFSVLAVAATYLLGSYAFSRWVGLAAALALALERDAIAWAAEGWRDDAMMCVFVLSCYALLRCARSPTIANAIGLGVIGGLAILTRITTLSFLLPGIVLIVWRGWRASRRWSAHVRAAALGVALMAAVAGPYLINCAIVFGDPFYSINYHTTFYRARAGLAFDQPMSVGTYLASQLRHDPRGIVMTFFEGLTTYPFESKWIGFDYWWRGIGDVLKWLSIVGLAWYVVLRDGRFLLILLMASLVPYAFTWNIQGGGEWRFTMHAYPIYLMAAALAVERLSGLARHWPVVSGWWRARAA